MQFGIIGIYFIGLYSQSTIAVEASCYALPRESHPPAATNAKGTVAARKAFEFDCMLYSSLVPVPTIYSVSVVKYSNLTVRCASSHRHEMQHPDHTVKPAHDPRDAGSSIKAHHDRRTTIARSTIVGTLQAQRLTSKVCYQATV